MMTSRRVKIFAQDKRLKDSSIRYFKIDMNRFKSMGPNVEDITICVSCPGGAGLCKEDSPERSPRPSMKMAVQ